MGQFKIQEDMIKYAFIKIESKTKRHSFNFVLVRNIDNAM